MSFLFYTVLALLVAALLASVLTIASPARLAGGIRTAGQLILLIGGIGLIIAGRFGLGAMLLTGAFSWFMSSRVSRRAQKSPGQRSTVRTAALEMFLDHDSGGLEGVVLAGNFEGRELAELQFADLFDLYGELKSDSDSRQLLETYLDGRFPLWREDTNTHGGGGEGSAPGSGPMTEQEAHQILGLDAGASAAEISKAHRRLMQRVHPDVGGSSFLAARINEAKDFLLSRHG